MAKAKKIVFTGGGTVGHVTFKSYLNSKISQRWMGSALYR